MWTSRNGNAVASVAGRAGNAAPGYNRPANAWPRLGHCAGGEGGEHGVGQSGKLPFAHKGAVKAGWTNQAVEIVRCGHASRAHHAVAV
jgi:hypothetical protein